MQKSSDVVISREGEEASATCKDVSIDPNNVEHENSTLDLEVQECDRQTTTFTNDPDKHFAQSNEVQSDAVQPREMKTFGYPLFGVTVKVPNDETESRVSVQQYPTV